MREIVELRAIRFRNWLDVCDKKNGGIKDKTGVPVCIASRMLVLLIALYMKFREQCSSWMKINLKICLHLFKYHNYCSY